mgnify:CR=1 FL=1|jgi:cytochrome c-type biogenesis protein CcmH
MLTLLGLASLTHSADIPMEFSNPQDEEKYKDLLNELRCLVCQNQTLADSHAPLAQDLRNEVYRMVEEGKAKPEIIEFLVARYGDFVLYKPPLKNTTFLLWFGPFILLLIAVGVALRFVKSRSESEITELDEEQAKKLKALLAKPENNK